MLIGLTVALPSATPVIGSSPGDSFGNPGAFRGASDGGMPSRLAASTILSGPFSIDSVMSMKAVLMEFSVAVIIETADP